MFEIVLNGPKQFTIDGSVVVCRGLFDRFIKLIIDAK